MEIETSRTSFNMYAFICMDQTEEMSGKTLESIIELKHIN